MQHNTDNNPQLAANRTALSATNPPLDMEVLRRVFVQYPGVEAVYLFGSAAENRTHAESDLDLAIVPENAQVRKVKLQLLADLARAGYCHVDLVFLDVDDIYLKFQAVRHNKLIYAVPGFEHGAYFSLILRQYFDFAPYLRVQRRAYKERLFRGRPGEHSASPASS